jgi:hypothetical protein
MVSADTPREETEDARVIRIYARYSGQFETLELDDPDVRAQLAFDLGFLVGRCLKLLSEGK